MLVTVKIEAPSFATERRSAPKNSSLRIVATVTHTTFVGFFWSLVPETRCRLSVVRYERPFLSRVSVLLRYTETWTGERLQRPSPVWAAPPAR